MRRAAFDNRADYHTLTGGVAQWGYPQHGQGFACFRCQQFHQRRFSLLAIAQVGKLDFFALVAWAELPLELALGCHRLAIHGCDDISHTESAFVRSRAGADSGQFGCRTEGVAGRQGHPEHPAGQADAFLQGGQNPPQVFQGHGEADSRVVPLKTGCGTFGLRRRRYQNPHDPPIQADQWATIIDRRHLGIGLDGLATDTAQRTDDPFAHRGRGIGCRSQGAA